MPTDDDEHGIVRGKRGESLFYRPYTHYERNFKQELRLLHQKTSAMEDERLHAIVSALALEDRLNRILSAFLPWYNQLLEADDFTLSTKIRLLQALDFVPHRITAAAHVLRRIRNEFAHHLDYKDFVSLPTKVQHLIRRTRDSLYKQYEESKPDLPLRQAFDEISFVCLAGIDSYVPNVAFLRQEIGKDDFQVGLEKVIEAVNEETIRRIHEGKPTSVERTGNTVVTTYGGWLVEIGDAPDDGSEEAEIGA